MSLNLDPVLEYRLDQCCEDLAMVMRANLPEIIDYWEKKQSGSFMDRLKMTVYLEMIHAGFFNE